MVTLVRKALLFIAVTAMIYAAAMFGAYHTQVLGLPLLYKCGDYYQGKGGVAWEKFQELDTTVHYDVMVIGSSHAYRGYDPRLFAQRGVRLFNLGTSAQAPMDSYYVLKNYVTKRNCGLLIFDLYENTMTGDGLESTSDLTRNITSTKAAWELCIASKDPRGLNLMALRWLSRKEPPRAMPETYRAGGFAERTDSLKKDIAYGQGLPLTLKPEQLDYLRASLAYCAEQGIPVVLSTHYYPPGTDRMRHRKFHDLIEHEIAGTGIRYIDLAYAGNVNGRDHFYDENHLNSAGVALFNTQLLDSLSALRMLPVRNQGQ